MKMGIWDYISSKADSIKRNAPDPTSVKSFCWSSYDHSRATVDKLYAYLPDAETQSKITTSLAKQTAHVAVREGAKLLPGGSAVYNIVSQSQSLSGNKISKEHTKELKELKDKVSRLEKEINDHKKSVEQAEMPQPTTKLQSKI